MIPATRKFILRVHLWLGLPAAAVYLVVALTGALLVYEKDLDRAWHPELWHIEPGLPARPLAELLPLARAATGGGETLREVRLETAGGPIEFRFEKGRLARLDPGTGAVLGTRTRGDSFFGLIERLHTSLVLGVVGKWIVIVATLALLALLLTGLVLWWPKQWRQLKAAVSLALHRRGRALHFNLHNTFGFWAALPLAAIALTGVVMAIPAMGDWLRGGYQPERIAPAARSATSLPPATLDTLAAAALTAFPDSRQLRLHAPRGEKIAATSHGYTAAGRDASSAWRVESIPADSPHDHARSRAWLDPRSAEILRLDAFSALPLGARLRASARPLHDGSIAGRPTQFLALLATLSLPLLSVTGVALWWLRRRTTLAKARAPIATAVSRRSPLRETSPA